MSEGRRKGGLTRATMSGMFWTFASSVVQALLQLVVLVILARLLPPSSFGIVQAALLVVGFSLIFSQLGVGPAVVQRPGLTDVQIRTGFTLSWLFGVGMTVLTWLLAPLMARFFHMDELNAVVKLMSGVFFVGGLSVVAESLVTRELRFRLLAVIEIVAFAVGFGVVGVGMALLGGGLWSLVAANLVQATLKSALLLVFQRHPMRFLLDRTAIRELLYFGGGFTAARLGNYLAGQGDSLVVGRFLGADALGLYGRAYQLMTAPANLLGQAVDRALFPAMAKVQHDSDRLVVAYRRGVALLALIMLPVSVPLCIFAREVTAALLGRSWGGAVRPLEIFALGLLFRTSYKMSDSIARATGAVYRRAWRQGVFGILVTLGAWAGQPWGISGAAIGVTAAIGVNFMLMAHLSLILANMTWSAFFEAHAPAMRLTLIYAALSLVLAFGLRAVNFPPAAILAVSAIVLAVTTLGLLRSMPRWILGSDGQWMLGQLASYLPKRGKGR
jgi:O-antigen/teichoic acid export membrane protein